MKRLWAGWRAFVSVGLLGLGVGAWGQGAPGASTPITVTVTKAPGDKYAGESIVIEKSESVYKMNADGTGTRTFTKVARIQSEAVLREVGVVTMGYASNSEKVEFVYVRARHPDGSVVETPGSEAIEISPQVTQQAPFYSDLKQKQIPVRSLKVGDTLEWQAKITRTKAEAPGQFWGAESIIDEAVVLSQVVELRAPKDVAVTVWSPAYKPVESVDGGERVWRWENSQLKPTTGAAAEAEKEARKKKVLTAAQELDAKEGKLPDIAWTTFKSWEEVGAWYRGLEGDRMAPTAEVKAKEAEVTAGKTTEDERMRAVYGYVATQVRYVGVAFGIGRFQPHEAADVLQNQYGDCKDKHTLLAAMLGALGLHPDAVLIGAGIRFNEAVPSPEAFNHLITRVMVDGKPVWLDTTSEVAPYEVLLEPIRDHAALVIPETGAAKVEKTPADLPFKAFQTLEANGSVDKDGTATSRMVLTERGDAEVYLRAVLRQIAPAQYDVLAQKLSESMGYGGKATHAEVTRAEDTAEPFKISYDYKRDKIADWSNKQILPEVAPVTLPQVDDKDPPLQSIALGGVRVETSKSAQKIPDGWRAELPEAIHQKSAWATVDQTYRFEKGVLYSERTVDVLAEKVPVADWKAYKKFCDDAMVGQEQYVTLVPTGADAKGDAGTSQHLGSNAAAAKLVLDAYNAIARHDLGAAGPMLDQAKQLNPEQARLWSTYGYLEYQRNKMANAAADYEKELALHPDAHGVYASLVQSQINLHHTNDAKETLRKWALVDPENPQPVSRLSTLLLTEGDALGAAAAVTASLSQMSADAKKDEGLQLLLGRAQIKAGMKDKGDATLVALLHATDNSGIMNDAAYELADAGLELPLAETMTQTALGRMEDESRNWTLDENLQTLRNKSSLIAATWDTRGWILFRDGKIDEAEKYVKAAWLNQQSSDIGEHVAAIALKKGDRDAALTALTLAIVSAPASDAPRLTAQAAELKKSGAKTPVKHAQTTLQEMRTLALGPANGLNGTAEYRMLLSADKVDRVEATGDKTLPGGDARLMKADFKGWVPEGSKAQLVKMVMLNCHSGVCELVIEP